MPRAHNPQRLRLISAPGLALALLWSGLATAQSPLATQLEQAPEQPTALAGTAPAPAPEPTPTPAPTPAPASTSAPVTAPEPEPVTAPEPEPVAAPEPEPVAAPEPGPVAAPEPEPNLAPAPEAEAAMAPAPDPVPEVTPEAGLGAPAPEAAVQLEEREPPSTTGLPRAPNLPLDEPVETEPPPTAPNPAPVVLQELVLLGREVPPKTSTRLAWAPTQSFEGIYVDTPVLVVNGVEPGPTLCLTAAMHGDELNGIETVRRVLYNLDAGKLKGAVIGVPIVNLQGFHAGSRYLTDRRDLNRYFPGDPKGSSASRLAYSFFHEVIAHCDALVDLHTGSFYRTNLPQLRGDLRNPRVVQLTKGFGSTVVVHSEGTAGTLRRAAVEVGIPAVTLEAGGPSVLSEDAVSHSVKAIRTLLNHLGMTTRFSLWGDPEPVYYNSVWERAQVGGIVFSRVSLGQTVKRGDVLGTVTNPITNVRTRIISNHNGRIIGMALNQVVQPGFATHHIGITPPKGQISPPEDVVATDPGSARQLADVTTDTPAGSGEEAAESEQPDASAVEENHTPAVENSADEVGDEDLEED